MHETTVALQCAHNIHVRDGISEADFIAMRTARDLTLRFCRRFDVPQFKSIICAGHCPPAEANGVSYLKIRSTCNGNADPDALTPTTLLPYRPSRLISATSPAIDFDSGLRMS